MSKLKRQVRRMWWDIKDIAFFGSNITRKNGMFMSVSNSIPVGSIYDIEKNIFGTLTDENLVFSHEALSIQYPDYPKIITDSAQSPTSFTLDSSNETSIDILSSMVNASQVANISTELSTLLKQAKKLSITIQKWGLDYVEEGELAVFLSKYNDARIRQILDGNNFIATRGIWVKGFNISYGLDKDSMIKIKALAESKQIELTEANISIDIKSSLELDFNFKIDHKFYPFFKFRKIYEEKKEDYYYLANANTPENDVFLDDVNFTEYSI